MWAITRSLRTILLLLLSPLLLFVAILAIAFVDVLWLLRGQRRFPQEKLGSAQAATIVIPNWNGREFLEECLPTLVVALAGNPKHEIIVVDNNSSDGSAELVRQCFPQVRVLELKENQGFGGGSNAGIHAAKNDIVVLLNNDMQVDPGFLEPLLAGFADAKVFAVSCQVFLRDRQKMREETGLTVGLWKRGRLWVGHRTDDGITGLYPCFYGGGGSCAFDRQKLLELGGFDPLFAPFYLEDTDLSYLAWKRGWKVLYQPHSVVYHVHRGTIGKQFSEDQIQTVLKKNLILFTWKNIHEWRKLASHFIFILGGALRSCILGDSPGRANPQGIWRAFLQLPLALRSRWRARGLAVIDDTETLLRPLGGYFRDRFAPMHCEPKELRVLFVSPYPIYPPVHGGGVLMYNTLCALGRLCEVHAIALVDIGIEPTNHNSRCSPTSFEDQARHQQTAHEELRRHCASVECLVRRIDKAYHSISMVPHAVRHFRDEDLHWLIHRQIYTHAIDVLQLEYMPMGQYAGRYQRIANFLFEHDILFQSIMRGLKHMPGAVPKVKAAIEYLRVRRYELNLFSQMDRVHVCSRENKEYVLSLLPRLQGKVQEGVRAGIDTSQYCFKPGSREPYTMLFLGNFKHAPNRVGLDWFVRRVLPYVIRQRPESRLVIVGSGAPSLGELPGFADVIELRGFVEDVREPLSRYAALICPILSGSGVRVKLLEAFAAGMPAVSTRMGAEGIATQDGKFCLLAEDAETFAEKVVYLFNHPDLASEMATRARAEVVANWDMPGIAKTLVERYREVLREKRTTALP